MTAVERGSRDTEMPARPCDVARFVLRPSQDLQSPRGDPRLLCLCHRSSLQVESLEKRAECVTHLLGFHIVQIGALGEIRTPDLLVRSQTLYPTELRARVSLENLLAEREGFEPSKGF